MIIHYKVQTCFDSITSKCVSLQVSAKLHHLYVILTLWIILCSIIWLFCCTLLSHCEVMLLIMNELLKSIKSILSCFHLAIQIETHLYNVLWRKSQDKSCWISSPWLCISSFLISFKSTFFASIFTFCIHFLIVTVWLSTSMAFLKHSIMYLHMTYLNIIIKIIYTYKPIYLNVLVLWKQSVSIGN